MFDFTFCALNLDISQDEITAMRDEVLAINKEYWYDDNFRGCKLLPIYNGDGTVGAPINNALRSKGTMRFTDAGHRCPTMKSVLENKVFTFMDLPGRISILFTNAGQGMNVHMDSDKKSIGTRQHKFRIVLNGEIGNLYFLDNNCNKVYVPQHYNTYVMDGTHPHSIDPSASFKMTLCLGTPWRGNITDKYQKHLEDSPYRFKLNRPAFQQEWECA